MPLVGPEHSEQAPEEKRLDPLKAAFLSREYVERFIIECHEHLDEDTLVELIGQLKERLAAVDDGSSPTDESELLGLISYAETTLWDIRKKYDKIEDFANGYYPDQK